MVERPPLPPEKPIDQMTLDELDAHIRRCESDYQDLLDRMRAATDKAARTSLDILMGKVINEKAALQMRRAELLRAGIAKLNGESKDESH